MLTDLGTAFCGMAKLHDHLLYHNLNDIEHTKKTLRHPQTAGICDRFHKTILQSSTRSISDARSSEASKSSRSTSMIPARFSSFPIQFFNVLNHLLDILTRKQPKSSSLPYNLGALQHITPHFVQGRATPNTQHLSCFGTCHIVSV